MPKPMIVNCPTCNKSVIWSNDSSYRPFCCKRCQLIDLGEWADEKKCISNFKNLSKSDVLSTYRKNIQYLEK